MSAQNPRSVRRASFLAVLIGAAVVAPSPDARARASTSALPAGTRISQKRVLPYPVDQVWGTAIRYLRVDRDYAIVDRDPETGYIVFEIPLGSERTGRGALEAFTTTDPSGRVSTQVQVSTEAGPTHLPHTLLDGIAKKLRTERGQAPPPPSAPPRPPAPDDGDDGELPGMPPGVDPSELLLQ